MNTKQKLLVKRLRLEVVCPAKARVLCGLSNIELMRSNYRFLKRDEVPLWKWHEMFNTVGLDLKSELRKLVKKEVGGDFDIKDGSHSGYLGFTSDNWIEMMKTESKESNKGQLKKLLKRRHFEKVAA